MREIEETFVRLIITPSIHLNHTFLRWLIFLCCACLPAVAQRKPGRDVPTGAPPPAKSTEVGVRRGDAVTIPLGIHGVRGEQLEFLIRVNPKQGTLGEIQVTGKNTASVTYRAAADATGDDKFFYAVRGTQGVSAPVPVMVRIAVPVLLPARLVAQDTLKFPDVLPGQQSTATFDLKNAGGLPAEGELTVEPPWRVEGIATYRLAGGETVTMKLAFKPEKTGDFSGEAVAGPKPRRVIALIATASSPLLITQEKITLVAAPGSKTRRAAFRIENRTTEPQKVTLAAGPRLLMDKVVDVPAKGGADVAVFAEADDVSALDDTLRAEAAGWSGTLAVHAPALGASLAFVTDPAPFSKGVVGQRAEGIAILNNVGGMPAKVTLRVGAPFELASPALVVPPKGTGEARMAIPFPAAGTHSSELVAEYDGATLKLPLTIEVSDTPAPSPSESASKGQQSNVRPVNNDAARGKEDSVNDPNTPYGIAPPAGMQDFPNGRGNFVRDLRPASAVLEWPRDLGPADNLRLEQRVPSLSPDGEMKIDWVAVPGAAIQSGTPMRAELKGLVPGRQHTVRVRSGEQVIFTAQFITPAKPPIVDMGWRGLSLILLFVTLVGLGWWKWKTRVRGGW